MKQLDYENQKLLWEALGRFYGPRYPIPPPQSSAESIQLQANQFPPHQETPSQIYQHLLANTSPQFVPTSPQTPVVLAIQLPDRYKQQEKIMDSIEDEGLKIRRPLEGEFSCSSSSVT
jgi:hypothetical protein